MSSELHNGAEFYIGKLYNFDPQEKTSAEIIHNQHEFQSTIMGAPEFDSTFGNPFETFEQQPWKWEQEEMFSFDKQFSQLSIGPQGNRSSPAINPEKFHGTQVSSPSINTLHNYPSVGIETRSAGDFSSNNRSGTTESGSFFPSDGIQTDRVVSTPLQYKLFSPDELFGNLSPSGTPINSDKPLSDTHMSSASNSGSFASANSLSLNQKSSQQVRAFNQSFPSSSQERSSPALTLSDQQRSMQSQQMLAYQQVPQQFPPMYCFPTMPQQDLYSINRIPHELEQIHIINANSFVPRFRSVDRRGGQKRNGQNEDFSKTSHSQLLEEFHFNSNRAFKLSDITNHIIEFSKDQYGSRFIQQKLETADDFQKEAVFQEVIPHAQNLMSDVFGNYVIQKFFEHGTEDQKNKLSDQLTGHVLSLSMQVYGCRVVQKAIEQVSEERQIRIVKELEPHVLQCVQDQNGNHVIQKCIECVCPTGIQFIVDAFSGQVHILALHSYGCRVIQRILERCEIAQTKHIHDELLDCCFALVQDQYGNYVIQHVIEKGLQRHKSAVIKKLQGHFVMLAQHKFASNVIEKCVQFSSPSDRDIIFKEVVGHNGSSLIELAKDPYANYVIQRLIDHSNDQQREMILKHLKSNISDIKRFTYGKHVISRLERKE